jgi:hypothetical protein
MISPKNNTAVTDSITAKYSGTILFRKIGNASNEAAFDISKVTNRK